MTDDERDELASAYLDGATTDEETALVEADPALLARVEELRRVRDLVAAAVPPPSAEAREAAIAAALAAATGSTPEDAADATPPAAVRPLPRRQTGGTWVRVVAAAAAVLAVLALVPVLAGLGDDDGDDEMATASDELEESGGELEAPAAEAEDDASAHDDGDVADEGGGEMADDDGGLDTSESTTTELTEQFEPEPDHVAPTTTSPAPHVASESNDVGVSGPGAASAPTMLYDVGEAADARALADRAEQLLRETEPASAQSRQASRVERRCVWQTIGDAGDPLRLAAAGVLDDEDVLVVVIRTQVRIARIAGGAGEPACDEIARFDRTGG